MAQIELDTNELNIVLAALNEMYHNRDKALCYGKIGHIEKLNYQHEKMAAKILIQKLNAQP